MPRCDLIGIKAVGDASSDTQWRTSLLPRLVRGELFFNTSQEVITNKAKLTFACRPTFETPRKDGHKRGTNAQTPQSSVKSGRGKKQGKNDEDKEQNEDHDELAVQVSRQLNVDVEPLPRRDGNRFTLLRSPPMEKEDTSASENEDEAEIFIQNSIAAAREREVSSIVTEQVLVAKAVSTEEELKERAETAMKERKRLLELPTAEEETDSVNGIPTNSEPGNFGRTMFVAYIPTRDKNGEVPKTTEQIREFQKSVTKHMTQRNTPFGSWGLDSRSGIFAEDGRPGLVTGRSENGKEKYESLKNTVNKVLHNRSSGYLMNPEKKQMVAKGYVYRPFFNEAEPHADMPYRSICCPIPAESLSVPSHTVIIIDLLKDGEASGLVQQGKLGDVASLLHKRIGRIALENGVKKDEWDRDVAVLEVAPTRESWMCHIKGKKLSNKEKIIGRVALQEWKKNRYNPAWKEPTEAQYEAQWPYKHEEWTKMVNMREPEMEEGELATDAQETRLAEEEQKRQKRRPGMFSFTMLVLNTSIADIMHGITKDINDQVLRLGAVTNQAPMDIRCQSEGSRIAGLSVMKCAPAAVQTAVRSFQAKQQTDVMQTDQENEAITALRQAEERLFHMRAGVEQQQQLIQQHTVNNDVQQVQVESRKLAQMIQEHDAAFQAFEEMRRQAQKEEARMEDELKVWYVC